ncbi:MAG: sigma-54 dependent transcriptional regulator [Acidobacteriota bacterium]
MNEPTSILVVDDEEGIRNYLKTLLKLKGYEVNTVESGTEALEYFSSNPSPSLVLLDILMPEIDGLETLKRLRKAEKEVPVIMLSCIGETRTIVEAMRSGATDYLNKPFEETELEIAILKALDRKKLVEENKLLRQQNDQLSETYRFVVCNPKMLRVRELIGQIANTDVTVFIQGESGVGKEIIAREIHQGSTRRDKPFVKVNCAALPSELLESELFGYERGAFTGAVRMKQGKFELANFGTLFLDEIGDMAPALQAKLLHVLQDNEYSRLGGKKNVIVDVRILAATNQNLEQAMSEGRFREDLYYRLNVVNITIPPLRERKDEVPLLVDHFLSKHHRKYNSDVISISPRVMEYFMEYDWPGNIRELENVVKRLVILSNEDQIVEELTSKIQARRKAERVALQNQLTEDIVDDGAAVSLKHMSRNLTSSAEKEVILRALQQTQWNRKQAAAMLNVSYKTLLNKIRKLDIK